jgi:hypothetical protein
VSEIAFPWATLRRSGRSRWIAALGLTLSGASVTAAGVAALVAPGLLRGGIAAICLSVLAGAVIWWRRPSPAVQLSVTAQAEILLRASANAEPRPVAGLFVAPWLIVVGSPDTAVPVWPDSLDAAHFRRLAVATRWRRPSAEA